jgi:hypothetical protein
VQSKARKDILQAIGEDVLRDAAGGLIDLPAVKSILGDLAERDVDVRFSCRLAIRTRAIKPAKINQSRPECVARRPRRTAPS